jgi:hypothetical protein
MVDRWFDIKEGIARLLLHITPWEKEKQIKLNQNSPSS